MKELFIHKDHAECYEVKHLDGPNVPGLRVWKSSIEGMTLQVRTFAGIGEYGRGKLRNMIAHVGLSPADALQLRAQLDEFITSCAPAAADPAPNEFENCSHPECGRFQDGAGWSCRALRDNACARDEPASTWQKSAPAPAKPRVCFHCFGPKHEGTCGMEYDQEEPAPAAAHVDTPWPTHADGRPKKMGDMTPAERKAQFKDGVQQAAGTIAQLAKPVSWTGRSDTGAAPQGAAA